MYDLRKNVKDYLEIEEYALDALFQRYARYRIHRAIGATKIYFEKEGTTEERRVYFKNKLY